MLKLIPVEGEIKKTKKQIKRRVNEIIGGSDFEDNFFKTLYNHLASFLKQGKKFTVQQIDDLIFSLQKSVLKLQKKKHKILKKEYERMTNNKVYFKKKKIQ